MEGKAAYLKNGQPSTNGSGRPGGRPAHCGEELQRVRSDFHQIILHETIYSIDFRL